MTALADPLGRLRLASMVEGTTMLLLLGLAMPMKHALGVPDAVRVLGPLHGAAFLGYLYCVAEAAAAGGWSRREWGRAALACLVPFGPFLNDRWLRARRRRGA